MFKPSASQKNWLKGLTERYHEALTEETRSYLASRGIGPDAVDGFLLGEVADPDPIHEQYRNRLAIPFLTPTGVVHMRFRCLEKHDCSTEFHGKYEGLAGEVTNLYNVQALHDAGDVIGIAEGELDALVATVAGIPTVGVPGINNWKKFYYRLFEDFETVYIFGDGDTAGRKFTAELAPNVPGGVRRMMPTDHDISSYVQEEGVEAFLSYVHA